VPISTFKSRTQYKAIANSELSPDVKELILQQISSTDMEEEDSDAELAEENVDRIPADASSTKVQDSPSKKGKRTERKEKASSTLESGENTLEKEVLDVEQVINRRYVDLVDIFPPVPEKGKFNIETIKDSLYFFS
jgi:DNA-directed RNA polymerase, mitochondrial